MIILVYIDDSILISKEDFTIRKFIDSMRDNPEGFELTKEGNMNAYLSVDISPFPDGKGFTLPQPFLIYRMIQDLVFDPKTKKEVLQTILQLDIHFWTKMKIALPGKHLGNTVVSFACLDICKEKHFLSLKWQPINEQYLIIIHTFHMNDQSSVSTDIYWILEKRAWSIDLTLHEAYIFTLTLIFQVNVKMVTMTLLNKYYHAHILFLCMLDDQFIGGEKFKQKLSSVLQKTTKLLCQPQWENWFHLWVLWKKLQVCLDYGQEIQYFVALSGNIMRYVSLLQRAQNLHQW